MTPSSELPACKAFPTHIPTTFSPTCHPNLIFSAPVAGMLWARCQLDCQLSPPNSPSPTTPVLLSLWNGFLSEDFLVSS